MKLFKRFYRGVFQFNIVLPIDIFLNAQFSVLEIIFLRYQKSAYQIIDYIMIDFRYFDLIFTCIKFVDLFFQCGVMLVILDRNFVLSFVLFAKSNILFLFF